MQSSAPPDLGYRSGTLPGDHFHDQRRCDQRRLHRTVQSDLDGRDERTAASILDLYENFVALVIENTQDALTGLLNRGAFDRDLELAAMSVSHGKRRCDAEDGCGYLAMLDIDHFKRINDRYGHLYGDEVLLLFATLFRDSFRRADKLYRYGGEEFAVIIDHAAERDVVDLLQRFRQSVSEFTFPRLATSLSASVQRRSPATACRATSSTEPTMRCTAPRKTAAIRFSCSTRMQTATIVSFHGGTSNCSDV